MAVPTTFAASRHFAAPRVIAVVTLALVALLVTTGRLYAGTITIVDGGNFNGPAVYSDEVIASRLITEHVTLDTFGVGSGPDDIRIESGVEIAWTSGFSLTLIAQNQIVVSGTIQHDGPADGSGGVALLAGGDVTLGLGAQPYSIAVGSRHGLTRVDGANVTLRGGDFSYPDRFVQLGFRAINQGESYSVTGPISVTASLSVTLIGGVALPPISNIPNYVQVGHGGSSPELDLTDIDGVFSGDIAIVAGINISATGGSGYFAYAQWATVVSVP
jgi:hypothetical protein